MEPKVREKATETENAKTVAEDTVQIRLREKQERLQAQIDSKQAMISKKQHIWPRYVVDNLHEDIECLKKNIQDAKDIQEQSSKAARQKFRQAVKRTASNMAESNRIKRRGPKTLRF